MANQERDSNGPGSDGNTAREARLQDLTQLREATIQQERLMRSDAEFRANLSLTARVACEIVDKIRREEQETLWTRDFEDSLATEEGDIYPGMMFSLAKERMEKSRLWNIIRTMPKGALLHCHMEAMVDFLWLLDLTFETEGIYVIAEKALDSDVSRLKTPFTFQYIHPSVAKDTDANVLEDPHADIWESSYTPNTPVPLHSSAATYPEGGKDGFVTWVTSRCTITPQEALNHHHGPNDVWRKFGSCFPILSSIINYEPIWRKYVYKMCQELHRDGVFWVDMRSVLGMPFYRKDAKEPDKDLDYKMTCLEEEVKRVCDYTAQNKLAWDSASGRLESMKMPPYWGGRLIWTGFRGWPKSEIIKDMKTCIQMKLKHPNLISGYDLVGQEDLGLSLRELLPELLWFQDACRDAGVHLPFFFHAGETLGSGDETDHNLFAAILLNTRRIGHGFSLYKHPLLVDMVKEKRILIESCPVSNEVLRLTSSIMSHPLPALLARGVPVSLCNDDPAILGQGATGMSHDFWQALQGWENLGLAGLGSLAENSVRWANFEDCTDEEWMRAVERGADGDGVRAERMQIWKREWELFCIRIIARYGSNEDRRLALDPEANEQFRDVIRKVLDG